MTVEEHHRCFQSSFKTALYIFPTLVLGLPLKFYPTEECISSVSKTSIGYETFIFLEECIEILSTIGTQCHITLHHVLKWRVVLEVHMILWFIQMIKTPAYECLPSKILTEGVEMLLFILILPGLFYQ